MAPQILLVDDNPTNLQVLYQTLDGQGYRLLAARSGKDAIAIAERAVPDLILLDVMMPDLDGFETCARLKADDRTRDCAIIFLSALTEAREKVARARSRRGRFRQQAVPGGRGPRARQNAPHDSRASAAASLRGTQALEHELTVAHELLREARERTDGVLLGDSAAAVRLRRDVHDAAASDEAWLINGPPGSDHEAVARAIHHQSTRAARAIICVNCLSLTSDSSPSSGSTAASAGIFDKLHLADGGTLVSGRHRTPAARLAAAARRATARAGRGTTLRATARAGRARDRRHDPRRRRCGRGRPPDSGAAPRAPQHAGSRAAARAARRSRRRSPRSSSVVWPSRRGGRFRSSPTSRCSG